MVTRNKKLQFDMLEREIKNINRQISSWWDSITSVIQGWEFALFKRKLDLKIVFLSPTFFFKECITFIKSKSLFKFCISHFLALRANCSRCSMKRATRMIRSCRSFKRSEQSNSLFKKERKSNSFFVKNDRFARKTKEQIPNPAGMFVKKSLGSNKKTVVHIQSRKRSA